MTPVTVIFHKNCVDGFGSALAAYLKYPKAHFVAHQYGDPPLHTAQYEGSDVYILDYSFKKDYLFEIARLAKSVTILDHHKTAEAELTDLNPSAYPNVTVHFNMHKSGAVLSWEYFHPNKDIPSIFQYIQDRDLWNWKLHKSEEVSAALSLVPFYFDEYMKVMNELQNDPQVVIARGEAILACNKSHVEKIAKNAVKQLIYVSHDSEKDFNTSRIPAGGKLRVAIVNSPILQSEIGNYLLVNNQDVDVAAVFADKSDVRTWSLRARKDIGADVSEICKRFGGGGHQAAAGMTTPVGAPFPRFIEFK
jgi:uncharacterized protein